MAILVKRSDKLAFMLVSAEFKRLKGFTGLTNTKNPIEYNRQFVDEDFENTDITGYSPTLDFTFDQFSDDLVHQAIVEIIDQEKTGSDAIVTILIVDKSNEISTGVYSAFKRDYAIVPDSDGDNTDAYTYSGSFKVKTAQILGTATLNADQTVATFTQGGTSI